MSKRDLALGLEGENARERGVGENKALTSKRRGPYGGAIARTSCATCRRGLHTGGKYCNGCAYARGVCSQCGVKIMDVSAYAGHETAEDDESGKRRGREASASVQDRRDLNTDDLEKEKAVGRELDEESKKKKKKGERTEEEGKETKETPSAVAPTPLAGPTSAADAAREMGQAANGGPVSGWRLDSASGYYYDVAAQVYYDPKTGGYFDCKTQQWTMPEKKTQAELEKGVRTGSFKDGTRKPDRFGL
ncbi:PDZ-binding protein, CRIPT [Ostreococcus tauri]|uniref:PDZ-binding protein, CRIPT n=1 Tax=Ostreococcus tauri TaxID=70448 RepID=Q018X9_OSTTA|nr:PDZ-binding protein, CRIPT [Ostreococcus tauri]CAL54046.1 PDZ-binding protein, CRIPT [Ostreococcus tauri]|eukprot:XP_003079388.1 PDZ-binding protein, CRIPT [Ostreococcus tauri]